MIFDKKKTVIKKEVKVEFKTWGDFTSEELVRIAKVLHQHAYGNVDLNFNDTFAPAAWGAVKEGVDKPMKLSYYPKFYEAKEQIEANLAYYYWEHRMKLKGGNP